MLFPHMYAVVVMGPKGASALQGLTELRGVFGWPYVAINFLRNY